jgi:spore germination protein KB
LLLIPHIDLNNLLPIFDLPMGKLLYAAHNAASFPFNETITFLMVLAFLEKPVKGFSAISSGLLIAGLMLILVAARDVAVLGQMDYLYHYSPYVATQAIELGDILTRVEVLVAINLVTMGFIKISVLFYGTVLGLAQVFKLHSYRPLILPIGILMVILSLTQSSNTAEIVNFFDNIYPIYVFPFQIGIPLITLIVAKLRRLPQKGEINE